MGEISRALSDDDGLRPGNVPTTTPSRSATARLDDPTSLAPYGSRLTDGDDPDVRFYLESNWRLSPRAAHPDTKHLSDRGVSNRRHSLLMTPIYSSSVRLQI